MFSVWLHIYGPGYTCSMYDCIYTDLVTRYDTDLVMRYDTDLVTHVLRVAVYIRTWLRMFYV